jgi:hypothetical protein
MLLARFFHVSWHPFFPPGGDPVSAPSPGFGLAQDRPAPAVFSASLPPAPVLVPPPPCSSPGFLLSRPCHASRVCRPLFLRRPVLPVYVYFLLFLYFYIMPLPPLRRPLTLTSSIPLCLLRVSPRRRSILFPARPRFLPFLSMIPLLAFLRLRLVQSAGLPLCLLALWLRASAHRHLSFSLPRAVWLLLVPGSSLPPWALPSFLPLLRPLTALLFLPALVLLRVRSGYATFPPVMVWRPPSSP